MRIISALIGTQLGCWGLNCYHFSGNPLHIGSSVRLDACEHDQTVCMYQQITSYVGRGKIEGFFTWLIKNLLSPDSCIKM